MTDKSKAPTSTPVLFDFAENVEELAEDLISKYHPDLATARFKYVYRSKASKSAGVPVPGKVKKIGGASQFAFDTDFLMEIALDQWNNFTAKQRVALIDHLLSRCVGEEDEKTGDMKWKVRPPRVQEFPEVAERNGQWNDGLIDMSKVLRKT